MALVQPGDESNWCCIREMKFSTALREY